MMQQEILRIAFLKTQIFLLHTFRNLMLVSGDNFIVYCTKTKISVLKRKIKECCGLEVENGLRIKR